MGKGIWWVIGGVLVAAGVGYVLTKAVEAAEVRRRKLLPEIFTRSEQVYPESAEQPCVLKVGSMYWMWFRPSAEEAIYLIKSPNGRTGWSTPILVVLSGTPADWENGVVRPYQMLSVEGTFDLYYGAGWPPQIGLATSIDGVNFTRYSGNPILWPGEGGSWDDWGVGEFSVQVEAGKWSMLYKGYGSPAPGWAFFGLAESPDGKTWIKKGKVLSPHAEAGESIDLRAIHFIKIQDRYYAFYSDSFHNDTFLASSANLKDWVHHGVAIPRGGPGSGAFDALWLTAAYPLLDGSTLKLWHEAGDDDGLVTIGYVEVAVEDLTLGRRIASAYGTHAIEVLPVVIGTSSRRQRQLGLERWKY